MKECIDYRALSLAFSQRIQDTLRALLDMLYKYLSRGIEQRIRGWSVKHASVDQGLLSGI